MAKISATQKLFEEWAPAYFGRNPKAKSVTPAQLQAFADEWEEEAARDEREDRIRENFAEEYGANGDIALAADNDASYREWLVMQEGLIEFAEDQYIGG